MKVTKLFIVKMKTDVLYARRFMSEYTRLNARYISHFNKPDWRTRAYSHELVAASGAHSRNNARTNFICGNKHVSTPLHALLKNTQDKEFCLI
jgi:hypothetical protein